MGEGITGLIPDEKQVEALSRASRTLKTASDLDPLVTSIGDARFVLVGEASHGTSEFYSWRSRLTRRLIEEKGFSFVAVEGDWPDCCRVNRYLKGYEEAGENAYEGPARF